MRTFAELKANLDFDGYVEVTAREADLFNPNRFSFRWNKDYSKAVVCPLLWWDDVSYLAYQGADS